MNLFLFASKLIKEGKSKATGFAFAGSMLAASLSAQQTYVFTTAGATGSLGPTQGQVNTAYASTNLNGSVTVSGAGIQSFTIPVTGAYGVQALGAQGYGAFGGRGADMYGEFTFNAGQVITILVGQKGEAPISPGTNQYGGGGGSFVVDGTTPLVVAGGGGGSWSSSFSLNSDASITTAGNNGANGPTNGAGGTNGGGGTAAGSGDGGGGYTGDGTGATGGKAFLNGGQGGGQYGHGGFGGGGGGSSWDNRRCGGGGGYSGGGGAGSSTTAFPEGGGGGSYNNGTNQNNIAGINTGDGSVIITRLCDVNLTASDNPICFGSAVTLSTNAGSNIQWSNGSTASFINVSPAVTTDYTVVGVSSSTSACSSTLVITVTVNPLPSITSVVNPSVLCIGNTATLTAGGASTYTWSNGLSSPTTTFNPVTNTIYTVHATDHNNCVNSRTVEVIANTNALSVTSNTSICAESSIVLEASGAATYTWSTGTHFSSIPVTPAATTTYVVSGTDVHNCVLSESIAVTVNPKPVVTAAADKDLICIQESAVLTAAGANTYVWSHGGTGSSVTVSPAVDVLYSYTVTGTDNNACSNTAVVTVSVSSCLGIQEADQDQLSVSVYPNPTQGVFSVSSVSGLSGRLIVTDVSGRVVTVTEVTGDHTEIDLRAFADGVYYVKVESAGGARTVKVVKHY